MRIGAARHLRGKKELVASSVEARTWTSTSCVTLESSYGKESCNEKVSPVGNSIPQEAEALARGWGVTEGVFAAAINPRKGTTTPITVAGRRHWR